MQPGTRDELRCGATIDRAHPALKQILVVVQGEQLDFGVGLGERRAEVLGDELRLRGGGEVARLQRTQRHRSENAAQRDTSFAISGGALTSQAQGKFVGSFCAVT